MPIFNEEPLTAILREELTRFLPEIKCPVEVVLVNDGSFDQSLFQLIEWARHDSRIHIVHLSRNFGHQAAATAGLEYATGEAVILMDADLQDPLAVLHQMIAKYCEGYDVVYGQRASRQGETVFKKISAWGRLLSLLHQVHSPRHPGRHGRLPPLKPPMPRRHVPHGGSPSFPARHGHLARLSANRRTL